jgi:two-component system, NarL family, sensor histidine kinase DegS
LNNAVRHADATLIQLDIHIRGDHLEVMIIDNGRGFEISQARPGGNGLKNIRSRMELIKGRAEFRREPGQGTVVTLSLPLPNLPKEN